MGGKITFLNIKIKYWGNHFIFYLFLAISDLDLTYLCHSLFPSTRDHNDIYRRLQRSYTVHVYRGLIYSCQSLQI